VRVGDREKKKKANKEEKERKLVVPCRVVCGCTSLSLASRQSLEEGASSIHRTTQRSNVLRFLPLLFLSLLPCGLTCHYYLFVPVLCCLRRGRERKSFFEEEDKSPFLLTV
jgi:hypothetical protein